MPKLAHLTCSGPSFDIGVQLGRFGADVVHRKLLPSKLWASLQPWKGSAPLQAMRALIEHPDQLRLLQERPELIPSAVEEFLHWASPVYHFRRTATRDVELGGKQIKKDDKVVMWFASGNRDADVFDDPYRFDVTRADIDHVTFGKGSPHLCLGNALARMEIRLMFTELIPRLASIDFNGDVTRVRSNFVNGIKKFPVSVTTR